MKQNIMKKNGSINTASLYHSSVLYSRRSTVLIATMMLSIAGVTYSQDVIANAQGGQVVSGKATIAQTSPNTVTITQSSDRAIVNWQTFNILNGETTNIIQPSSRSVELERVASANPTQILGTLTSNGQVWIVNSNGVFFGKTATVNVAGLIASAADISNRNFVAGNMVFDRTSKAEASIINQGNITAAEGGLVALIAPGVKNDGVISVKLGTVALGAGQGFTVDVYGDNLYSFALDKKSTRLVKDENGNVLSAAIVNNGTLSAKGGTIYMTANAVKGLVDQAINTTGIVDASAAHYGKAGTIILDGGEGAVTVAGTLNASGNHGVQTGGKIQVLSNGSDIHLASANVDASGANGGGQVNIGSGAHGQGYLAHAKNVTVDANSTINVNANRKGNGGSAVVWSDNKTMFKGKILAKGGVNGGNGGFVETSGKVLSATGTVDASAAKGQAGGWLLDPNNIKIQDAGADTKVTGNPDFTTTDDNAIVTTGSIETALNSGTNVSITTSNGGTNSQSGIIEISNNIDKILGPDAILRLNAASDIILDAGVHIISTAGKLGVTFASNTAGAGGAIVMNQGSSIITNNGDVVFGGGTSPLTGYAVGDAAHKQGILLDNAQIITGTGSVTMHGKGYSDASTSGHYGVWMKSNSLVQSTSGKINIFGNGGFGNVTDVSNGSNNGIYLGNDDGYPIDNSKISSATGDIALAGVGGDGNTFYSSGVDIYHGAVVESTGTGAGAANVTITGTGGNGLEQNFGLVLQAAGNITTIDGNITINGTSGISSINNIGNAGVWFSNDSVGDIAGNNNGNIISTGKGNITITGTGNNGGASILTTTLNGIGLPPEGALIGGAGDTGNITLNGNNGDIVLQNNTRVQTQGEIIVNTANDLKLIKSSLAANNININTVNNVTLAGASKMTATNALDIDNTGAFSSDTAGVLKGVSVELEQSQTGSIQSAVDAVDVTSGTTNLTLDAGSWNENVTISGHSNFNLRGQGMTKSIINSGGGTGSVLNVKNASNDNVYGLGVNGNSGVTKAINVETATGVNIGGSGLSSFEHNNGVSNAVAVSNAITGIYTANSLVTIDHDTISNAITGINVNGGLANQITNNTLFAIAGDGIDVTGGASVNITDNKLSGVPSVSGKGINLTNVGGTNTIGDGTVGGANTINQFASAGIALNNSTANVNNNSVIGGIDGITVTGSSNSIVQNNTVSGTSFGVVVETSNGVGLIHNTIDSAAEGIYIDQSNNGTVSGNLIGTNSFFNIGVFVSQAATVNISGNTLSNGLSSGTGVLTVSSTGITVGNNNIGTSGNGVAIYGGSTAAVLSNTLTGEPSATNTGVNFNGVTGTNSVDSNVITQFGTGVLLTNTSGTHVGSNTVNIIGAGNSAVVLDNASNTKVVSNKLTGAPSPTGVGIKAINGSNNLTIGDPLVTDGNTIKDFGTGISLIGTIKATIANNVATDITGGGIAATDSSALTLSSNDLTGSNPSPDAGISITGGTGGDILNLNKIAKFAEAVVLTNAGTSNKVMGTIATGITGNGIDVTGGSTLTISHNTLTGAPSPNGVGVNLSGVGGVNTISSNEITQFGTGVSIKSADNTQLASNTIVGMGNSGTSIGVLVKDTDGVQFNGEDITNTGVSIQLDNAQHSRISGVTLKDNGVGLSALNSSGDTLVRNTQFTTTNASQTAILLNGSATSLQFGDTNSSFNGPGAYFVLQNQAMTGQVLDASLQTFNDQQAIIAYNV